MRTQSARSAPGLPRRGFSLVELLVVMVLFGIVSGMLMTIIVRQQRFYRGTNEIIGTRDQLRQATSVLQLDLRGISSGGGDIYAMGDSAIQFRSTFGSGVVCVSTPSTSTIVLPPRHLVSELVLTSWLRTPESGDSLFVYDEGPNALSPGDDAWRRYEIFGPQLVAPTACPSSTGFTSAADTAPAFAFNVTPALSPTIRPGAAVRFFQRAHYGLYRASDGRWYLGYYNCRPSGCGSIQPVSGPHRSYASRGSQSSGLSFTYYDSTGAATTVPTAVARIDVVVRGQSEERVDVPGTQPGTFRDFMSFTVALRNRR